MSFIDKLKDQQRKSLELSQERKRETIERMGANMISEAVEAIKECCVSAAENGKNRLSGYLAERQDGQAITSTVTEFDIGQTVKPSGNGFFIAKNYGADGEFAEFIRAGLESELKKLGFLRPVVRTERMMFFRMEKVGENADGHGGLGEIMTPDEKKYVIFVGVEW